MTAIPDLTAPFPWFGGKRRVAELVWSRFGDVASYNEPFAGSLAVLLGRPTTPRVETVNDKDAYLANFWRAIQAAPDEVAHYADSPVNEADIHARHRWLVLSNTARVKMIKANPEYYNAKVAGWWVHGQCAWIGSGWCQTPETIAWEGRVNAGRYARGVNAGDAQSGVHRRFNGGGKGGGSGVHAPGLWQQAPDLSGSRGASGRGIHCRMHRHQRPWLQDGKRPHLSNGKPNEPREASGRGVFSQFGVDGLYEWFNALSVRLRRVRVLCGDWERTLTPSVTTYIGVTGVFLDPPYAHELRERCYSEDHDISAEVRAWALANGDHPAMRIALCGYQDEHGPHMPASWECVPWKAHGGYSRSARAVGNRDEERIWFSPHCQAVGLPFGTD